MRPVGEAFRKGRKALVAYLTVGYPDPEATLALVPALAEAGCDLVELGIPFSDPLADGTTIQRASYEALLRGITPRRCLEIAAEVSPRAGVPLLFMGYYNPIMHYGPAAFCADAAAAGIGGLIVPDLPPEEGEALQTAAAARGISLVYLLSPTSPPERIATVAGQASGFIYLVSLTGVTGARAELSEGLEDFVARVRAVASQPLCVGFGVSTPAQAARVAAVADGVIVGSRLLQVIEEAATQGRDPVGVAAAFIRGLREAMDSVPVPE
ncbi:MAG: tryptophan synthase subunit alpha [Bacteroidetes bacterium]|nr:tryptophan synthase subunit alpha [Bacteroidota bacterium]MCL5026217.1 tryptophan synthase subunit alpha [Chloroflexota bacterium]